MKNQNVVVAEDELFLAKLIIKEIESAGYTAHHALTGVEALELIDEVNPKVVLLDLVMPEMDGFTVLEKLKAKKIKLPVFVFSNLSQTGDKEKVLKQGAEKFFVKADTSVATIIDAIKKVK